MHPERDTRIPVTIITGFLGSGKTTLLNHWVKQPELSDCAVLINEFGSVGLDHQLVKQVDEQVMLLDSGCICCSVQGSLATALQELFMKALRKEIKPFRRLIIETTGLADPAPVLFTLRQDNFIAERYRFDGIVTLVDAVHIEGQLARQYEAVKQIALADLLVISKSDLVSAEALSALQNRLGQLNGAAPQHVEQVIEFNGCLLKDDDHTLSKDGLVENIGNTEYKLLKFFVTHRNKTYSRAQLLDMVWGDHVFIEERTVDVHILRLRKILQRFGTEECLETVRGIGYRWQE